MPIWMVQNPMLLEDARSAANRGKEWYFRLEMVEGKHDKFWEARGKGDSGEARVFYGRNGTAGTTVIKSPNYAFTKAPAKIRKGYEDKGMAMAPMPVSAKKKPRKPPKRKRKVDRGLEISTEPVPAAAVALKSPESVSLKDRMKARKRQSSW